MPSPEGYGFEKTKSYYFSHMLNCVYDCRYCFLQGMYRSANYVLFVNYEEFSEQIEQSMGVSNAPTVYYSGYDCDSLALEPVSKFCDYFLPVFERNANAVLEIRTKSTQIRSLLNHEPLVNCVLAMSSTAHAASEQYEYKVPTIAKRIEALQKLQQAGWPIAIRFEPIIWEQNLIEHYRCLFDEIFTLLDVSKIHSVSMGEFRMPADFYKNIVKLYPDEKLFARPMETKEGMILLGDHDNQDIEQLEQLLLSYINSEQYYRCA
ncbi:MAG: DNA photolyase [Gammaproteobacteria bacterium]|nr:DNA photolyase [Gammaproteobacteria bacterium]